MKRANLKSNTAITLVALIITIIVLLILAGITLSMVMGESGIFAKSKKASLETLRSEAKETIELGLTTLKLNKNENRLTSEIILDEEQGLQKVEPKATNLQGNSDEIQGIYNNQNGKTIGFTIDVKNLKVIIEGEEVKVEPSQPDSDKKEDNEPTNTPETSKRDTNESLLMWIKNTNETGYYDVEITVEDTKYTYPVYLKVITDAKTTYSENIALSGELEESEFTNNILNKRSLIYKYKGDLEINSDVEVTAYTSKKVDLYYRENGTNTKYGEAYCEGPLGLFMYVEGTFTNNGTVTMKDRGATAVNSGFDSDVNVIMWKYGSGNSLENYYYIQGYRNNSGPYRYYLNTIGGFINGTERSMNGFYNYYGDFGYRGTGVGRIRLWI